MLANAGRALAAKGFDVHLPDYYGTGDSAGDFEDADPSQWTSDLVELIANVRQSGSPRISFLALRTGALLLPEILRATESVSDIALWQPVTDGKQWLNQFLRLRITAAMMEGRKETTAELKATIEQGTSLEVAGYMISPAFFNAVEAMSLKDWTPPAGRWGWFELVLDETKPILPVSQKVVDSWIGAGADLAAETVLGSASWQTQEIAEAPVLLARTTTFFDTGAAG